MCTINKCAHTKKSGNLFNDPRIYLYIEKVKRKKDICLMVCLFANQFRLRYFFVNARIFYQYNFRMRNNYDR